MNTLYSTSELPFSQWWSTVPLVALLTYPFRLPFLFIASLRENRAFRSDMETAWAYCESVWDKSFVHWWCGLTQTPWRPPAPEATFLIHRFAQSFPDRTTFLLDKARSSNPVLSAYAILCLADPKALPTNVLDRPETITLRDWMREISMPLGEWAQELIARENDVRRRAD
jgi:hypothetical protein